VTLQYRRQDGALSVRSVRVETVVMERSLTLLNVVDTETGERRQYQLRNIEKSAPLRSI
jgi:hypothetical protein